MSAEFIAPARGTTTAARAIAPIVTALLGQQPPITIRCWDGSELPGPPEAPVIDIRSPNALRRMVYAPGELGLARAYVAGELDLDGDIYGLLDLRDRFADPSSSAGERTTWLRSLAGAKAMGVLGPPLPPPAEEVRLRRRLHSKTRDAAAISHHYDVGNEFYRLVLGPSMTYSCAYFTTAELTLADAQAAKYELVCRKLGLAPGMRLLDVGCGWGGMVRHAALHHGVQALGITLSAQQAEHATAAVREAGLEGRVTIELSDYRDLGGQQFDAISSIGMFEHVGGALRDTYFTTLLGLLRPGGRLLNHAISRPSGEGALGRRTFIQRYVFPDGELMEVGRVVTAMQELGFEVRDVESLREHYALTLRRWVANLEAAWDRAVELVGDGRARVWRLYMAASAVNFEAGRTAIHQTLAVKPEPSGRSGMPLTRLPFVAEPAVP